MMEKWGDRKRSPCFFMDLNLLVIDIVYSTDAHVAWSVIMGSARRFDEEMKRLICHQRRAASCTNCSFSVDCPFPLLCGRQLSSDPDLVRRHQRPGVPFVFKCLSSCHSGPVQFRVVLIGPAIHYLSLFLELLWGSGGDKAGIKQIRCKQYQGDISIYDGSRSVDESRLPVLSAATLLDLATPEYADAKQLLLRIETPLRLMHKGHELMFFNPKLFVKAVVRRLSALFAYYGSAIDTEYFRLLAEQASQCLLLSEEVGARLQEKAVYRGVSGSFVLTGENIAQFGPILQLGSLLHVGKAASFGSGGYTLRVLL